MALKEERVFVSSGEKKASVRRETNVVSGMRVTIVQDRHQKTRHPLSHQPQKHEVEVRREKETSDVDRAPTHKTHLCSTVCSQGRTAQLNALGSKIALSCHLVLHMSHPCWLPHLPFTTCTSSSSFTLPCYHGTRTRSTTRHNMINSENTQYIMHIPNLPQWTSCAIKNHSGLKTCRVAETRARQLHEVMGSTSLRPSRESKHILEIHINCRMYRKNLEKKITELRSPKK